MFVSVLCPRGAALSGPVHLKTYFGSCFYVPFTVETRLFPSTLWSWAQLRLLSENGDTRPADGKEAAGAPRALPSWGRGDPGRPGEAQSLKGYLTLFCCYFF